MFPQNTDPHELGKYSSSSTQRLRGTCPQWASSHDKEQGCPFQLLLCPLSTPCETGCTNSEPLCSPSCSPWEVFGVLSSCILPSVCFLEAALTVPRQARALSRLLTPTSDSSTLQLVFSASDTSLAPIFFWLLTHPLQRAPSVPIAFFCFSFEPVWLFLFCFVFHSCTPA